MKRRGVSLIELLFVVAIIGILASLILPAAMGAFERVNRMKCENNWYQFRLAGAVAPTVPSDRPIPPVSPFVLALNGYERGAVYDLYNFEHTWDSPQNHTILRYRPGGFTCPNAQGGDKTKTTYAYDLVTEKKIVKGVEKVVFTFIGCEVSREFEYTWTDPRGYNPKIVDQIKQKDGRRAFFRNHGEGHYVDSSVVSAFGGKPDGAGMHFNSDEGLIIKAWTHALKLDQ